MLIVGGGWDMTEMKEWGGEEEMTIAGRKRKEGEIEMDLRDK